jgi:prepilin-type N-terminal cleavage/methylation domain-containing protein
MNMKHPPTSSIVRIRARGFTLIELMVSMAIFISVLFIAMGAVYSAQSVSVQLEQNQVILDGVNLAVEVMTRDIRYGSTFYCGTPPATSPVPSNDCAYGASSGANAIAFKPANTLTGSINPSFDRVVYYISNGIIYKNETPGGDVNLSKTYQITTPDVKISQLTFYVQGAIPSTNSLDYNQPVITVIIQGQTIPPKTTVTPVTFKVQTSISSRGLDY